MPYADIERARGHAKLYYKEHAANYYPRQRERMAWRRRVLRRILQQTPCAACGDTERVHHFHHVAPSRKKDAVMQLASCSLSVIIAEVDKCTVLCVSCHHKAHGRHRNLRPGRVVAENAVA